MLSQLWVVRVVGCKGQLVGRREDDRPSHSEQVEVAERAGTSGGRRERGGGHSKSSYIVHGCSLDTVIL